MSLTDMIQGGGANPVFLFCLALLLGGLHGLEPGHSKTMMAAYIVAIQGTVQQAILLGLSAAFSHSIIVWILAGLALTWGNELIGEELEPWFMITSGVIVMGIAVWMFWRSRVEQKGSGHHHDHPHSHDHHHDHHHTHQHGHGLHHGHQHDHVALAAGIDAPHMDAHARAHAAELRERLSSGRTGTWQTVLFGLSGGLIPCPAAITVFILCLHLDKLALGITLVGAFSAGLAITLVTVGVVAAMGLKYMSSRSSRLMKMFDAVPWLSAVLIALIAVLIMWTGISHLHIGHTH